MKVSVDSNITIPGVFDPPIEVELKGSKVTLRDLLRELDQSMKTLELLKDDKVGYDVEEILVNGERDCILPKGLETELGERDSIMVKVNLTPFGGG